MTTSSGVLAFPNPVNENVSRVVSAGVAVLAILALLTGWHAIIAVLALGFLARALADVRLSLLGRLAATVAPRLGPPRYVPGPPQRFAQAVGFLLTGHAAVASLLLDQRMVAVTLVTVVLVLALMESVIGLCAACALFGVLISHGWGSVETRKACEQVWQRYGGGPSDTVRTGQPIRSR